MPGEIIVAKTGRESFLAVGEGVVEITANRVAIVTDMAIPADHIDEAKVEEARQRAAARLKTSCPTKRSPRSTRHWRARWRN